MEEMRGMRSHLKMPFFYELVDVWKAMLLAYGLIDESDISYLDKTGYYCGEDGEWILRLSEQIKSHWDKEFVFHENHHQNIKRKKEFRSIKNKEKYEPGRADCRCGGL